MQIHEITIQEGLGWEIVKGIGRSARDQFIQKATGVGDPYQKTDMKGYVDPDAPIAAAPTTTAPTPNSREAGAKARARLAAKKGHSAAPASAVNAPAAPAAPVVYRFDGRALDPRIPGDAGIIKTLQAAGVTSATSGLEKSK